MKRLASHFTVLVCLLAVPASASAQAEQCVGDFPGAAPVAPSKAPALRFGTYPGGPAGQIGPVGAAAKPDDRDRIRDSLAKLHGGRGPFVVHLYANYFANPAAENPRLDEFERELAYYSGLGYEVEIVLRYRPDDGAQDPVAGYEQFLRRFVRRFGGSAALTGLQATNEVNITFSKDTSDGAYTGARDAVIKGVIAAKDEARALGYTGLEVGFNWAYRTDPPSEKTFWEHLRDNGGPKFISSVDYVGLDAYPGTIFPPQTTDSTGRSAMYNAMDVLRDCFMPLAKLGDKIPIHVGENGWPTGPGRSPEEQATRLEGMVRAIHDWRGKFNVTDHRWFTLRDADSSSPNFQQQYGLLRDDYSEKRAFGTYRTLVAALGRTTAVTRPPPATPVLKLRVRCSRGSRLVTLLGATTAVRSVQFRLGRKRVTDGRRPFKKRLRGRGTRIRAVARLTDGRTAVVTRRIRRCR